MIDANCLSKCTLGRCIEIIVIMVYYSSIIYQRERGATKVKAILLADGAHAYEGNNYNIHSTMQ